MMIQIGNKRQLSFQCGAISTTVLMDAKIFIKNNIQT